MKRIILFLTGIVFSLSLSAAAIIPARAASGPLDGENLYNAANYVGDISATETGVIVEGKAYYDVRIPLDGITTIDFEIAASAKPAEGDQTFAIGFLKEKTVFSPENIVASGTGLYFLYRNNGGKISYAVKFIETGATEEKDGNYIENETSEPAVSITDFFGGHSISLQKGTYDDFPKGVHCWLDRNQDKMKSTRFNENVDWTQFAGEDGFVLSIATNGCSVKIASDVLRPVPDDEKPVPNDFNSQLAGRAVVFEEYFFPEIVFTDNVDGVVDYEMTVTDQYNVSQSLGKNATSFLPEYEGVYIFEISARDKKGNVYTDKFSVMTVLADGAPMLYQENVPEKNGRTGVAYTVEPLVYDDDKVDTLDVYVVGPDGKRLSDQTLKTRPDRFGNTLLWQFTPSQVGEYRVMFYAGNSFGAAKIMNRVYVKYNTEGGNVYEMFRDEEHWEGSVSGSGEGIVVSGDADCKLPFSLEEGVCLDLTLSDRMDSWFALHFSNEPGQQRFYFSPGEYTANGIAAGLHVLIYRQQSGYYCDAFYVGLQGVAMAVVNHTSCGADRNVKISLKKNANMDDNICFYINGKLNENYEIANSCKASVCSDNEGFTYLSFSNLTNGDAVIHSVDVYDSIAPEIRINGNLSDYVGKGTTVRIPEISAIDAHDGEMPFTVTLYSPDGKKMDTDGSFVAGQDGIYYLIVKSSDLTGNVSYVIFEIGSGNTEKKTVFGTSSETESASAKKGCKGSVGEIGGFGFLLFLSGAAITAKRKISHEH